MIFRYFDYALNVNIGKKLQVVNIKTLKLSVFIFIIQLKNQLNYKLHLKLVINS